MEIAEARSEVMAPLSAASMESYTRAYPYLVKLHMLQASFPLLQMRKHLEQHLLVPPIPPPARHFICESLTSATERQQISVPLSSPSVWMDVAENV